LQNNYVVYHLHSDYSLLDSTTKYQQYIDKAVSLGQTAIAFTEHGKPLGWVNKKMACDEAGIKYIHGVEIYLTEHLSSFNEESGKNEKTRDNYHTVLLAKNFEGFKELNAAVSMSCDAEHTYYKNRLSFDEFMQLSDNIIKISACLASPLNKLSVDHEKYYNLLKHYDYLEIQHHDHDEQKQYNVHLAAMSDKFGIPLIAGTDTHYLDSYYKECRDILMNYKKQKYGDEDKFDLAYKSYDEIVSAYKKQNALPESLYLTAIDNTNVMADSVETFEIDTSIKYPILYGTKEKDEDVFVKNVYDSLDDKLKNGIIPSEQECKFKEDIKEELRVFHKIDMCGFMQSMSEFIRYGRGIGIPFGPRGSACGSRCAYVTDILDLNPVEWDTVFSRFANEDRVEIGDIDVDLPAEDVPKMFKYITSRFTEKYSARVPTFGTAAKLNVIEIICGAFRNNYIDEHYSDMSASEKVKQSTPYDRSLESEIKEAVSANIEDAKKKYPKILYYYDGIINTKISQSIHSAGIVVSPVSLHDNYCTFLKEGERVLSIDMDEIHECGLAKYDFLTLRNIKILNDAYKLIGVPYQMSHEINFNDNDVYKDMSKSRIGIFQFEKEYAHSLLKEFNPASLFDITLVTAAIRPSGNSYRKELISKQKHKNPSEIIDKLLEKNYGYLVFQEDTIKFLQQICGLSGSESDNIRRGIARKKSEILTESLPSILNGYCNKSNKSREISEQEAQEFIQIIEDSSSYQFGYNHATGYSITSYRCAYLRYYYPKEFITALLMNAANEEDVKNGTELADVYGIKVLPPKFGISKDNYFYDKESSAISKGIGSVKYINKQISLDLYDIYEQENPKTFVDLLCYIKEKTKMNSRQLDILIKIGYFSKFGNDRELLLITEYWMTFKKVITGESKQIKKDKIKNDDVKQILSKYTTDKNKDGSSGASFKFDGIDSCVSFFRELEIFIKESNIPDLDFKTRAENQLSYLGYIDLTTQKEEDRRKLLITDVYALQDKFKGGIWKYKVSTKSIGSGKVSSLSVDSKQMDRQMIQKGDIVYANSVSKDKKGYWNLNDYRILTY